MENICKTPQRSIQRKWLNSGYNIALLYSPLANLARKLNQFVLFSSLVSLEKRESEWRTEPPFSVSDKDNKQIGLWTGTWIGWIKRNRPWCEKRKRKLKQVCWLVVFTSSCLVIFMLPIENHGNEVVFIDWKPIDSLFQKSESLTFSNRTLRSSNSSSRELISRLFSSLRI